MIFAASAGLAILLTNFDNLAVLFGLLRPLGALRAVFAYVVAQALVLAAALSLAEMAGDVLDLHVGYLGVIPISLGLFSIWRSRRASPDDEIANVQQGAANLVMALVTFLIMSVDSFSMMVPLLTDSAASFRMAAVVGAGGMILLMGTVALAVSGLAERVQNVVRRAEKIGPYVMILAGTYILLDSATDVL